MRILMIDNFDSFTYNLVDELARRGAAVTVVRGDRGPDSVTRRVAAGELDLLFLSPGPGHPAEATLTNAALQRHAGELPIFGVCLGLQAIVEHFGGRVGRAAAVVHGKASPVHHDGRGIFTGLADPFPGARYHSLIALHVPDALEISARSGDEIMAVRHRELPIVGVQFHPESILTAAGGRMFDNLFDLVDRGGLA